MNLATLAAVGIVPALTWGLSYVYLAGYYRTWRLWGITIHESGRYTLGGTILYYNHFLRELPIDSLYTLCLYWSLAVIAPPAVLTGLESYGWLFAVLLGVFLAWVGYGSIRKVGARLTLLDLFQFRELDTVNEFGSHWQMHFLSTLAVMLIAIAPATLFDIPAWSLPAAVFLMFLTASAIFRTGRKAVTDKRWLMHGGREILTFIPLAIVPAFLPVAGAFFSANAAITGITLLVTALIGALGAYYLWALKHSDVSALAQGGYKTPYLIASHFFEHVLDFIYMTLLMLCLLSLPG